MTKRRTHWRDPSMIQTELFEHSESPREEKPVPLPKKQIIKR